MPKFLGTLVAVATLSLSLGVLDASAEQNRLRIAQTYAPSQIPTYVLREKKIVEKHLAAAGLDTTVEYTRLSSGADINDLVLSGNADIGVSGIGPLSSIWDKTQGDNKVRGMMGLALMRASLMTSDPKIKSIEDLGPDDRVAMTVPITGTEAVILRLAAAKKWGEDNYKRLDQNMVGLPADDAMGLILSGKAEVKSHLIIPPWSEIEKRGGARVVMTSDEVFGTMLTAVLPYTTERFRRDNPKTYQAVRDAYKEAIQFVKDNKREAAEIYLKYEPKKVGVDEVLTYFGEGADINFDPAPQGFFIATTFLNKVGALRHKPDTWKDFFFDEVWTESGS
ncbi:MAG: ABC transporter substrate-binding protein [Rhizobiaceae bacterium]